MYKQKFKIIITIDKIFQFIYIYKKLQFTLYNVVNFFLKRIKNVYIYKNV